MADLEKSLKIIGESCKELGRSLEKNSLQMENMRLKAQISEMQSNIDRLQAELRDIHTQKVDLPTEPIKVADMLIDKFTNVSEDYVRKSVENGYQVDETAFYDMRKQEVKMLHQIAEHLLVYCNNAEVE